MLSFECRKYDFLGNLYVFDSPSEGEGMKLEGSFWCRWIVHTRLRNTCSLNLCRYLKQFSHKSPMSSEKTAIFVEGDI